MLRQKTCAEFEPGLSNEHNMFFRVFVLLHLECHGVEVQSAGDPSTVFGYCNIELLLFSYLF